MLLEGVLPVHTSILADKVEVEFEFASGVVGAGRKTMFRACSYTRTRCQFRVWAKSVSSRNLLRYSLHVSFMDGWPAERRRWSPPVRGAVHHRVVPINC